MWNKKDVLKPLLSSCRCPEDSRFCVTATYRYPNLQDDSDANYNDRAGRLIKLERGCEKVKCLEVQPAWQRKEWYQMIPTDPCLQMMMLSNQRTFFISQLLSLQSDSQPGCQNTMLGNMAVVECRDYCDHDGCNFSKRNLVSKTLFAMLFIACLH